jgi:small subunit ribosomal protein S10
MNMKKSTIRIILKAYDNKLLDIATKQICSTAFRTGAKISGPVPLPMHINKIVVNRSPHIDKKSRDQLEIRTYKRLLDIVEPTPNTLDALMKLELSAGVNVQVII